MSVGEIVTVYRNLASQAWTTLPDEQWMRGLSLAVEKRLAKKEASAQRAELQKKARGYRPRASQRGCRQARGDESL